MGSTDRPGNLAVLTSGGDAPGMNPAVRAVIRAGIHRGLDVYAITEGYRGMVAGGDHIQRLDAMDVGGILHRGGTVIGTARSDEFRTWEGRRTAARNLVVRDIDGLVVIGGDGSLTGADLFRREWPDLLAELVEAGDLDQREADAHPHLRLVGLVGSIDNDMFGTDMTIGADTALHRITEAVDALTSTAASHQRTFVIEVMGRHCGYLALMASLATGANWVLIPENPPDTDDWRARMCDALRAGREIGRRQSFVIVAEGAQNRHGEPITAEDVTKVLEQELGEDTRLTILGHVQRGGAPSAFDRTMSTMLGKAAVDALIDLGPDEAPLLIGWKDHRVVTSPLMEAVEQTHAVADRIAEHDYEAAMRLRGGSFADSFRILRTLVRAQPRRDHGRRALRLGVMHAGGPAPGMNTAVRVAVRLGLDKGHTLLGIENGFAGLRDDDVRPMNWMSVSSWVSRGGAELGTSRWLPSTPDEFAAVANAIEEHELDGLLMIGGWAGYQGTYLLRSHRDEHPAFDLPIVCLPASINNDLPGSELSIGADTALNAITVDVDKIKQSAVASRRCFVVEVMGHDCGYLALMGGLATGAERVYLPEEGITLDDLQHDVHTLADGFRHGKRLGLVIRGEHADETYTTGFIHALFEKEGGDLFDVRQAILGHVQQGGDPSPFDRIQATRLTARCVDYLVEHAEDGDTAGALVGLQGGKVQFTSLDDFPALIEPRVQRPIQQRWMRLRSLAQIMAGPPRTTSDRDDATD